ncbi:MAG: hypothetical protein IJU16_05380 [Clostridia bacterium]|nr:hypothetical protein [Clostridia bacterium]
MAVTLEEAANAATEALQSAKSAHKRIDALDAEVKDVRALANAVGRLDEKVGGMREDITELKAGVKELTNQPGERWDAVIKAAISGLVGALIGAVMALVLK